MSKVLICISQFSVGSKQIISFPELDKKKRLAQKEHNWRVVADCSNKLGALYSDNGDYERAIVQFKDECAAYKSLGMRMAAAHAQRMIGEMLMYQGEYDPALKYAQSYLSKCLPGYLKGPNDGFIY